MARDPHIEERLQRWAQYVQVGDGSGFPVMSVLHPAWQPPSPGQTPTMKAVPASDVRETHRAISRLSTRLRNTVVMHYVLRGPLDDQAARLGCAPQTVHARIDIAHRLLAQSLSQGFCNIEQLG